MIGFLQQLHWREPAWLLLAMQPLLIWLVYRLWQDRQQGAYAQRRLQPWVMQTESRNWSQRLLSRRSAYVLAWLLFALAAAGPRIPLYTPQANPDKGMNILVVMDVSRSMSVNDILPNRLRRAEIELHELLARARGQRVGVVVFAARAHLFVPLTWDFAALRYYLRSLDKLVLPTRGSRLTDALVLAKDTLIAAPQYGAVPSAMVLISDGDDFENSYEYSIRDSDNTKAQYQAVTRELAELEIPVYVLGVGSSEGGSIPLPEGGWLSYENKPVISRMNESGLQHLAEATGGRYHRATDDDSDWRKLFDQGLLRLLDEEDDNERLWRELYPWLLFPAIALFFTAVMPLRLRRILAVGIAGVVVVNMVSSKDSRAAENNVEPKAYEAYNRQEYDAATRLYAEQLGYRGRLGEGAAYYRLGDYQGALRRFSDAVLQAEDPHQRAAALFNLGNSYFQQGDYQTAARTFEDVLRYTPEHPAARHNLQISKRLYEQISEVLIQQDSATMAGRGPRTSRRVRELNLSDNASLAIDNSEEDKPPVIPQLPEDEQHQWQELIRKGLEFVQVAAGGASGQSELLRRQELAQARLFMLQIEDQPATLWQHLFELEEGFAAPQRQPHEIPGVPPW